MDRFTQMQRMIEEQNRRIDDLVNQRLPPPAALGAPPPEGDNPQQPPLPVDPVDNPQQPPPPAANPRRQPPHAANPQQQPPHAANQQQPPLAANQQAYQQAFQQPLHPGYQPHYPPQVPFYQMPPQYQQPAQDRYQNAIAQTALAVAGFNLPPLQEQGESPLAPFLLLGSTIDNTIKSKVWEGKYLEIGTLSSIMTQPTVNVSYVDNQAAIAMSPPKSTAPSTYKEWTSLFRIYMVIRMDMYPQEGQGMITYAARIGDLEASEPTGVWYEYDVAFRKLKAIKQDLPWQRIVTEILWPIQKKNQALQYQSAQHSGYGGQSTNQPFRRASGGTPPYKTCTDWYYKGICKRGRDCRFKHLCGHCQRSGHNLNNCRRNRRNNHNGNTDQGSNGTAPKQQNNPAGKRT